MCVSLKKNPEHCGEGVGSKEPSPLPGRFEGINQLQLMWKQISSHGYNLKPMKSNIKTPKRNAKALQPGKAFAFNNSREEKKTS
jgi:hypothetical protein